MDTRSDDTRAGHRSERQTPSFWASPAGWVALGFIGVAGYFLITEHAAHVIPFLPWLLFAASSCITAVMAVTIINQAAKGLDRRTSHEPRYVVRLRALEPCVH